MAETTKKPDKHDEKGNPEVSFERRDVDVFQISAFGIGLLIACVVVVFAMWAMFDYLFKRESDKNVQNPPAMMRERPTLPPEPRLQGVPKPEPPRIELKQMRDDEEAILNNYGLLDPAKGTVRIPIDLAIDMTAKKGLPSKPSPAGMDNDGYRTIPSDASGGRTLEKIAQ
jgi:hypothetical protein